MSNWTPWLLVFHGAEASHPISGAFRAAADVRPPEFRFSFRLFWFRWNALALYCLCSLCFVRFLFLVETIDVHVPAGMSIRLKSLIEF